MIIAVLTDIHDNYHNMVLALKDVKNREPDALLFLGDFINAGIASALASSGLPLTAVWGNNDGDKQAILKVAGKYDNFDMGITTYRSVTLGKRKLFLSHYPDAGLLAADTGKFDAVFFGHTHYPSIEGNENETLIVNPGELSAHKTGKASYALYDTKSNTAELILLENIVTVLTPEVKELYRTRDKSDFADKQP